MRTLIDIPDEQIAALSVICEAEKTSRSEVVRRGIALYIEQSKPSAVQAFGLWRSKQVDGMAYQDGMRAEW
ncbi:MAG: ribbon-helix-helix domain-containing protein [Gallionella sp.]